MNLYATAANVRSAIGETDVSFDAEFLRILRAVSRTIDRYCRRHFYTQSEAGTFDAPIHIYELWLPDLLVATTVKTDPGVDQTFTETIDATDYLLYPLNEYPKLSLQSTPYATWLDTVVISQSAIQVTGFWGYGNGISATPYLATSITATVADTTSTTLTLSAEGTIEAGQTILVETEQMYVQSVTSDGTKTATVRRGMNGTTAAAHAAKTASVYEYPADVVDVAIRATIRKAISDPSGNAKSVKIGQFSETFGGSSSSSEQSSGLSESEENQLTFLRRMS